VLKEARTKLDSKGVKCIFISYCEESKGYKFYNLINQYVIISHDVIFDESRNFNRETMVSRLGSRSEQMVIIKNYKWRMKEFFNMCKKI
jgi:hypothetical protein